MTLPTFTCPKCGAVADLQFRDGVAQEAVDEYRARLAEREGKRGWQLTTVYYEYELLRQMEQDAERGDRLVASCPRCKYHWQEKPLDAAPSGTSPIHDAVWAQWGASTQWGGSA